LTGPPDNPYRPLSPDFGELASRSRNDLLSELFRDPLDPGYADAAQRRAQRSEAGQPPAPRWRYGTRAVSLVTLAVVGLLLAVAYRQVVAEEPTRAQVRADLEAQIHDRQDEAEALGQRADELRDEVAELRDQQLADPAEVQRLRELEATTGLGRVRGDGVVVRVDDGPPGVDPKTGEPVVDPLARILDRDLQQIANALWGAGAEAIAINDRRLTATSTIRSASGAILVDRQPLAGPYEIAAVGPDELRDRFAGSETGQLLRQLVDDYGITFEVRDADDLTLPAAAASPLYHATVP
jgi:uncharacterized protein YlxW (UPF0749 family)